MIASFLKYFSCFKFRARTICVCVCMGLQLSRYWSHLRYPRPIILSLLSEIAHSPNSPTRFSYREERPPPPPPMVLLPGTNKFPENVCCTHEQQPLRSSAKYELGRTVRRQPANRPWCLFFKSSNGVILHLEEAHCIILLNPHVPRPTVPHLLPP